MGYEALHERESVIEREGILYVSGPRSIARISSALANETRTRIIELLSRGPQDLDEISKYVGQSKANVSSQIRKLEDAGIVTAKYQPGERGIKKLVELRVSSLVFQFTKRREQQEANK